MQLVQASQANILGEEYYRFREEVLTIGFGIEFDIGVRGIFVGPDSDFSQYKVYYFDPLRSYRVELATITAQRPFVNRLTANNAIKIPELAQKTIPSSIDIPNQVARLIVVPDDTFDRQKILSQGGASLTKILDPIADVIATTRGTEIIQGRADKKVEIAMDIPAAAVSLFSYFYFPTFGQKSITLTVLPFENTPGAGVLFGELRGIVSTGAPFDISAKVDIGDAANIAPPFHYEATQLGCFDYVLFQVQSTAGYLGNDPQDWDSGGFILNFRTCE